MTVFDIDGYEELLNVAELQAQTRWEIEFVATMKANTFVSDAQLQKLEKIAGI